ncbi:MAG: Ldh family oxidoreductase [Chloroflexota bacterium]
MPVMSVDRATSLCRAALKAKGMSDREADDCTNAIMFATRRGLDSHGIVSILVGICKSIQVGRVETNANVLTIREGAVTAVFRGNSAAGPVAAAHAMRAAIAKAREHGVGITTVMHAAHFGAASVYASMAADAGLIGLVMCNAQSHVAPFGGRGKFMGTNPIAYAVPSDKAPPIVLDIATSAAAFGQIMKAHRRGQTLPAGWALDKDGNPTTDAAAALEGMLQPFGGHKGYGLGVLVDLLTGALTGTTVGHAIRQGDPGNTGGGQAFFFLAINPEHFCDEGTYRGKVDELVGYAKTVPPAEGFKEVLLPGELEWREERRREKEGIPLADGDWKALSEGLAEAGVPAEIIQAHTPAAS